MLKAYYNGQWKDDKKNGQGVFDWGDGSKYDGQFVANIRCGRGTYYFPSGDRYTGDWRNDKENGKGIYTFANETYTKVTMLTENVPEKVSSGIRTATPTLAISLRENATVWERWSGAMETNMWVNGKTTCRTSQGKLTKHSGDIFDGEFHNGRIEGQVIIHFANGSKFKGTYLNGRRNGPAIEETKDGRRFEILQR